MSDIEVRVGNDPELLEVAWRLRRAVFIEEQGIDGGLDRDGLDASCWHALALKGTEAVAVGRMDSEGKIGRVATLKAYRGMGYGTRVMEALETHACEKGVFETHLYSQESAIGFYSKIGYEEEGERFVEAGIPHQQMKKILIVES